MTNTVDLDQAAHIEQSDLGSQFELSVMLCNYLQQTTLADDIHRCGFVNALMVKLIRGVSAKKQD